MWKAYGSHSMSEWLIVAGNVPSWPIGQTTEITAQRERERESGPAGAGAGIVVAGWLCAGKGHVMVLHTFKFMCNLTLEN